MAAFVAVLAFIRQPRTLQRYTYTLGAIGLVLLALPALLPTSISEVPGHQRQDPDRRLGGFTVQPEEFAKLAPGRVLRRLPGGQARRAGPGRPARCWASTCPGPVTWARC